MNAVVALILQSPLHRFLSKSVCLLCFQARRSGRHVELPTQYACVGEGVVILVGKAENKQWWRNFETPRSIDVLVQGEWRSMTGHAVVGAETPAKARQLLDQYLARFPHARRTLPGSTIEEQAASSVLVECVPRSPRRTEFGSCRNDVEVGRVKS